MFENILKDINKVINIFRNVCLLKFLDVYKEFEDNLKSLSIFDFRNKKNKTMENQELIKLESEYLKVIFTKERFVKFVNKCHSDYFYHEQDSLIGRVAKQELQNLHDVFGTCDVDTLVSIIYKEN